MHITADPPFGSCLSVVVPPIKCYSRLKSVMMDTKRSRLYDMSNMLKIIKALILRKNSCVLATTDGETPHCSLMAYVPGESGEQLFLITSSTSRKYQNILQHPRVSLLIDTRGEQQRELTQALTVTGTCDVLQDRAEIAQVKAAFAQQHPHLRDFIRHDDMTVICVQADFFLLLDGPERAYHEVPDKTKSIYS